MRTSLRRVCSMVLSRHAGCLQGGCTSHGKPCTRTGRTPAELSGALPRNSLLVASVLDLLLRPDTLPGEHGAVAQREPRTVAIAIATGAGSLVAGLFRQGDSAGF